MKSRGKEKELSGEVRNGQPEADTGIGKKPELAWLSIDSLCINESYQRSAEGAASRSLIAKIAAGFRWEMFQPLTVCAQAAGGGQDV